MLRSFSTRSALCICTFLLGLVYAENYCQAQGIATALIGGAEAKSAVDRAGDQARSSIEVARRAGDGLISREASELMLMSDNANLILNNALQEGRRTLNQSETNFFGQLQLTTANLQAMVPKAFELKDTAVVDVAHLESEVPFVKVPLFVQRVTGLAQVRSNSDFHLGIVAFGITPGTEGSTSTITVALQSEDNILQNAIINPKASGEADISIRNADLMRVHIDDDTVVVVPAFVKITVVEQKKHIWSSVPKPRTVTARFFITLYPRQAGVITVTSQVPVYTWVFKDRMKSDKVEMGDGTTISQHTFHLAARGAGITSPKQGDEMLANPERYCELRWGNDSALCDKTRGVSQHKFWHEDVDISSLPTEDGRRVDWGLTIQGEKRAFWIEADRYVWTLVGSHSVTSPPVSLMWGATSQPIKVPDDATSYQITGSTVSKKLISLGPGMSVPGFLTVSAPTTAPNSVMFVNVGQPEL